MEMIRYPVPPLAVRRLVPDEAAQIAALYRTGGRDGAWCAEENTVRALFDMGAVWWGGFADGVLALCAVCAASTADTPQAAALRGALWPGIGNPAPERFLLPPAVSLQGEVLAEALLLRLTEQLFSFAADAPRPKKTEFLLQNAQETAEHCPAARWPREDGPLPAVPRQRDAGPVSALLAALPVKAPAPLLAAYFAAGFAAVRMRPLVSLRPHYLLVWRGAPGQENNNGTPQEETTKDAPHANIETSAVAQNTENSNRPASTESEALNRETENNAPPSKQEPDALRRVYLPLADTLAVSRLLEQGFYATALCRSSADERMLIQLERGNGFDASSFQD